MNDHTSAHVGDLRLHPEISLTRNQAPEWAKGTFLWRINPADSSAIEGCAEAIGAVHNLLDGSVRSNVFVSGLIGMDSGFQNWDGCWPYFNRASFRVNHDWGQIRDFMLRMRELYGVSVSFHTNITDVNVGLAYSEETQAFFDRLRDHACIYSRDIVDIGGPYRGEAYVPDHIPVERARMPYLKAGDASDFFAVINYQRFWDCGMAKEMLDRFFELVAYPPMVLYIDVLSLTGNNCNVGYPDGALGGSAATQAEGRRKILDYIRSKGSVPGGEGPGDWTDYNWNHGGLSSNDYSRIQSGYCQGNSIWRGIEPMHVYGNQGAYSIDLHGEIIARCISYTLAANGGTNMTGATAKTAQDVFSEHDEWRDIPQLLDGFYLTTIQELYHIGKGNVRLPGGSGIAREDEHRGRVRLESYTVRDRPDGFVTSVPASAGENTGAMTLVDHPWAATGRLVAGLENSLACSNRVRITVPEAGAYTLIIRYYSPHGGTADLYVNGRRFGEVEFPATVTDLHSGDVALTIQALRGENTITLRKGCIHASWSDGTMAKWDHEGFRAWNGEVVFGVGYDRMWPDSWSGQQKIYFYSREGCNCRWRLPDEWAGLREVELFPLTATGRGAPVRLPVTKNGVTPPIPARVPCILVPVGGREVASAITDKRGSRLIRYRKDGGQ